MAGKTGREDPYKPLRLLILGTMALRGESATSLAPRMGYSRQTVSSRLRCPETLTLRELRLLAALLGIAPEEILGKIPMKH